MLQWNKIRQLNPTYRAESTVTYWKTQKRTELEQGMFKKFNELYEIKGHNPCRYTRGGINTVASFLQVNIPCGLTVRPQSSSDG